MIPAQYAKFITALVGQALLYLQYKYGSGNEWVMGATALAAALGVLGVPNAGKPAPPPAPAVPSNVHITPPPPASTVGGTS